MKQKIIEFGTQHSVKVITSERVVLAVVDENNEGYILAYHGLDPLPPVGEEGLIIFERNSTPAKGHWQYYSPKKEQK